MALPTSIPVASGLLRNVREELGRQLFAKVAGPEGPQRQDRLNAPGPRWFEEDRPIRRVHGDASMFVGGVRALLLQSLHPLAMAGVAAHSGYKGDPWGRLQRTSHFVAVTTYGTATDAAAMVRRVRAVHRTVVGTAPDGRRYDASDPHLMRWVHIAEVDSFLVAHQRYGSRPLDAEGRDDYVSDMARVAEEIGVPGAPRTEAELRAQLQEYRPELRGTPEAREAARFIILEPPLPLLARAPYGVMSAAAVGLLPLWARWQLRLPYLPITEATMVRIGGEAITRTIRWAMTPS